MNKNLLLTTGAFVLLLATSCVKEYDCRCTYVPSTILGGTGQNISENSTVKARFLEDGRFECDDKEDKYWDQNYDGDCNIE